MVSLLTGLAPVLYHGIIADIMMERMNERWPCSLVIAGMLLACVVAGCAAPADSTWERLQDTGVLRIGMDASFPPFESIAADGSLVGFDVEMGREVSSRLGLEPEFIANLPYDGLYDALKADRVDIVISALVIDPSRTGDYAYSRPYFDAGPVLVWRAGDEPGQSLSDLGGRALAVVLGTEGDREARRWTRRLEDLELVQHSTAEEALQALKDGEADAALVDHVSAMQSAGGETGLVVGETVASVPYACAVRRESRQLLDAVNDALVAMEDDGTMDLLIATWLR